MQKQKTNAESLVTMLTDLLDDPAERLNFLKLAENLSGNDIASMAEVVFEQMIKRDVYSVVPLLSIFENELGTMHELRQKITKEFLRAGLPRDALNCLPEGATLEREDIIKSIDTAIENRQYLEAILAAEQFEVELDPKIYQLEVAQSLECGSIMHALKCAEKHNIPVSREEVLLKADEAYRDWIAYCTWDHSILDVPEPIKNICNTAAGYKFAGLKSRLKEILDSLIKTGNLNDYLKVCSAISKRPLQKDLLQIGRNLENSGQESLARFAYEKLNNKRHLKGLAKKFLKDQDSVEDAVEIYSGLGLAIPEKKLRLAAEKGIEENSYAGLKTALVLYTQALKDNAGADRAGYGFLKLGLPTRAETAFTFSGNSQGLEEVMKAYKKKYVQSKDDNRLLTEKIIGLALETRDVETLDWLFQEPLDENIINAIIGYKWMPDTEEGKALVARLGPLIKKQVLDGFRTNLKGGLKFLIYCFNTPNIKTKLGLQMKIKDTSGFASQTSILEMYSDVLDDFNIVVKVNKYSEKEKKLIDIESRLYDSLRRQGIFCPETLETGKMGDFYVGVYQCLPGRDLSEVYVTQELLTQSIECIYSVQNFLAAELKDDEKEFFRKGRGTESYSNRINRILESQLGVHISKQALLPLEKYLSDEKLKNRIVWVSDRHLSNLLYDSKSERIGVIDFNVVRENFRQEDWSWFIDDSRLKTGPSRTELIAAFAEYAVEHGSSFAKEQEIELFHYVAIYRTLRQSVLQYSLTGSKSNSRHGLARAKESAKILRLNELVSEIETKIEPLFKEDAL